MKETKKNGAAQSKAGKRDYSAFKNMYRKIPQDLRDVIVYYIGDRPLVIHEGVNEVTGEVVTAEFIRQWHMDRDREVYNNNKHLKPPADEHKKKQIREWEEAHPGEKCPDSYNLSLDASFADDEGSEDKGKQGKNKGEHTMNDKTREQIEAMKNQTIGVEIEMNNITREKAARKVAEYFGTRAWNAAGEYGYYSWACKDQQGRVWKFQRDVSIYGPDAEKCELVTPILTYNDIEPLQEIIRLLRKAGAKSGPSRGCGVHIHIGKGDHTAKTIRNLVNIMAAHEQQIGRAIRIDAGRTGQYCRVVDHRFLDRLNREKPTTMRKLEDIWYEGNGSSWENRNAHYNSSRYHMLNLHATFTKGTIEFRLFQFADPADGKRNGLHAGEMKAYIQLCLAMSQLAKMVRTASPKPQQTDNEKYAMRCWMLRLGFIGDEFATAREILLRNMEGNASWRNK